ncbi:hypothetical protein ACEN2Y_09965 [Ralstonia solanacearum]|uniref:hypothetical protein n=1 Tax=Ralstonia solanacearum TaxID=305 RepID=UPI003216E86E
MGTNLELRELYVKLGTLQNQKTAAADMAFAAAVNVDDVDNGIGPVGDDAASTGISTFRKISMELRGLVCGNSELKQAAQGAGLTEDKVKEVVAGIVASALGLGGWICPRISGHRLTLELMIPSCA